MTDTVLHPKLSVAIIDDEFYARSMLVRYISQIPELELVGQYDSCIACYDALDLDTLDILLLDINMPDISGMQFARTIAKHKTRIIFTTAHTEHAFDAYQVHVTDYLLKPIAFDRFSKAIQKVQELITPRRQTTQPTTQTSIPAQQRNFIFVKSDYKIIRLNFAEILYVEGLQEYIRIYLTRGKPVVVLMSLKKMASLLPSPPFFRVHRSYIVNIDQLDFVQQRSLSIAGKELNVGRNYEEGFFRYLSEHGIF